MELSRFHAAIEQIADDYKENGIEADLNALVANLASLAANPGNAQVSQAFKDQLNSFRMNLEESSLNDADGELLDTLKNQDLIGHVGNGLFRRIKEVLDENQLTPNLASAGIEKLRVETTKKLSVVTAIDNAFTDLQVEIWRLDEGLTEMLISIPIEEETKTLVNRPGI
jgi:transcriptional regulator of heat shock response